MLQSIKPRVQQPLLTSAPESPILTAKQDPRRRIKRTDTPPRLAPKPNKQPQHRRHYSVPDNVLLSITATPIGNIDLNLQHPSQIKAFDSGSAVDLGTERQRQEHQGNSNFFLQQSQLQQIHTAHPANTQYSHNTSSPIIPRSPFQAFVPDIPQDASNLIDELLSFGSPTPTARSPVVDTRPEGITSALDAVFSPDLSGRARARTFPQAEHGTSPHQHLSTFDLAPLPDYTFINMSSLIMPTDEDVESFYSAQSVVTSPTYQQAPSPSNPPPKDPAFQTPMPTIPEAKSEQPPVSTPHVTPPAQVKNEVEIKNEPLPETPGLVAIAPKPGTVKATTASSAEATKPKPRKKGRSVEPIPASAITETGISIEEISAYISQPSPVDGKWVCLYPDCKKRFGRKENIKSHIQTHLGDRQYQCQVCTKCFVRQHDLKRHAKIHTGIKPYPCLCGNSFARHDALTRHRQRGMCVGAFEGIVKKVAKRGRPRKRSADDMEEGDDSGARRKRNKGEQNTRQGSIESTSGSSSCSSDVSEESDARTPRDFNDVEFDTPCPETPSHYDSAASSVSLSVKEDTPDVPIAATSPAYTPPTSPPDFYDFGSMVGKDIDVGLQTSTVESSFSADDIDYVDLGLQLPTGYEDGKKYHFSSDLDSSSSQHTIITATATSCAEEFIFSQEMFTGLTTLERDPSILGLGPDEMSFIKPEMLSSST